MPFVCMSVCMYVFFLVGGSLATLHRCKLTSNLVEHFGPRAEMPDQIASYWPLMASAMLQKSLKSSRIKAKNETTTNDKHACHLPCVQNWLKSPRIKMIIEPWLKAIAALLLAARWTSAVGARSTALRTKRPKMCSQREGSYDPLGPRPPAPHP